MNIHMRYYVSGEDYGEVYRLFTNPNVNPLIINKPDHNSMSVFSKWFERNLESVFHDFLIFRTDSDEFIGFAYSYEFNGLDGHCLFSVAVKPEFQSTGVGSIAAIKILNFLFDNYNLRKVYIHIYGNNAHSIECVQAFGFRLEGKLVEYRYYKNQFVDLLIYSISRSDFYDIKNKINVCGID